jgi:hypothetical protein
MRAFHFSDSPFSLSALRWDFVQENKTFLIDCQLVSATGPAGWRRKGIIIVISHAMRFMEGYHDHFKPDVSSPLLGIAVFLCINPYILQCR